MSIPVDLKFIMKYFLDRCITDKEQYKFKLPIVKGFLVPYNCSLPSVFPIQQQIPLHFLKYFTFYKVVTSVLSISHCSKVC